MTENIWVPEVDRLVQLLRQQWKFQRKQKLTQEREEPRALVGGYSRSCSPAISLSDVGGRIVTYT